MSSARPERFIRRHNITTYKFNPHFPINTLALMRMAVAARESGALMPYVDAAFHHMLGGTEEDG